MFMPRSRAADSIVVRQGEVDAGRGDFEKEEVFWNPASSSEDHAKNKHDNP
jgi:hypothetical protein